MHLEANNTAAPAPALERKYKGVWLRQWGKWVAEIRLPNSRQRVWLGSYDTPEKAARAFDAAFVCLRGAGANAGVNFPESPPPAVARTRDLREVYASAVSHANRPPPLAGETAATAPVEAAAATAAAQEHDEVRENIVPPPPTPSPVQVAAPAGSFDWSQLMANSPPLYSLMAMGSHAYDDVAVWAATLAVAEFSEEDDEYEGTTSDELWNFDV